MRMDFSIQGPSRSHPRKVAYDRAGMEQAFLKPAGAWTERHLWENRVQVGWKSRLSVLQCVW